MNLSLCMPALQMLGQGFVPRDKNQEWALAWLDRNGYIIRCARNSAVITREGLAALGVSA